MMKVYSSSVDLNHKRIIDSLCNKSSPYGPPDMGTNQNVSEKPDINAGAQQNGIEEPEPDWLWQ